MSDKFPYPKWVGVVLGLLLHGSAHFLSGKRSAALKWYFGLSACGFTGIAFLAIPGTFPFVLGAVFILASFALWLVMLKHSYRPVRRIGFLGWVAVIVLSIVLNIVLRIIAWQFVCPFKVPTGAMQPTIYGIQAHLLPANSADKPNIFQQIFSGTHYLEVKANTSGMLSGPHHFQFASGRLTYTVNSQQYELPRLEQPLIRPGDQVSAGDILWSGVITAGDHLFVERLSYRFKKPKRGDIIVFRTDGITNIAPNTFYIKRIAGLPGERIRIEPPYLIVNDKKVTEPEIFETISTESNGYTGYQYAFASAHFGAFLTKATDEVTIGPDEYFVLGDNTSSSLDSRYWGTVPKKNILGRATRIYWPFSRINALEKK